MSDLIGKTLNNRFLIEEPDLISDCGYKVLDIDQNKHYLLKLLPQNLIKDKVFVKHFLGDAQRIISLKHPNLHGLFGAEFKNGYVYLVFDFVNAVTLAEVYKTKNYKLTKKQILSVMISLFEVLFYLHENGYIYHDFRPQNILMEKSGRLLLKNSGFLMVGGILENRNNRFITPVYLAPEQIEDFESSPSSNIYNLGVLLYEMLTYGKFPFTGDRVKDYGSNIEKIIREKSTLPPVSPCEYNPKISPELEKVLIKSLCKDSGKRYKSVLEFKQAFLLAFKNSLI